MNRKVAQFIASLALLAAAMPGPALADPPNFGDDTGRFAMDGECDDMRFDGPGMTDTPLVDSEIFHDASDCRAAFSQNRVRYLGGIRSDALVASSQDNTQRGTNRVLQDDHAVICRASLEQGRLELRP